MTGVGFLYVFNGVYDDWSPLAFSDPWDSPRRLAKKMCNPVHLRTEHVPRGVTRSPPRAAMRQIEGDTLAAVTGQISKPPGVPQATASAHPKLALSLWPSNAHKQHVNLQIRWSLPCGHRRNPRCLAQQKCRQPAKQFFQPNFGRQSDSGLGVSRYSACKCQWAA